MYKQTKLEAILPKSLKNSLKMKGNIDRTHKTPETANIEVCLLETARAHDSGARFFYPFSMAVNDMIIISLAALNFFSLFKTGRNIVLAFHGS